MFRIGLTGGIAAGKSVATTRLAQLGAVVIDYDLLARESVMPGSVGLAEIVEEFGEAVLAGNGSLDRAALGSLVFADAAARRRLNDIVHPEVRRLSAQQEASAAASDPAAVIVHDIPLLVESGQFDHFHLIVVVHTPTEQRVQRLVKGRGLSEEGAYARIAAQATDEARLAAADYILDGSGSEEDLRGQVDILWQHVIDETGQEQEAGFS